MNMEECVRELHRRYEPLAKGPSPLTPSQFLTEYADKICAALNESDRQKAKQRFLEERQLLDNFDRNFSPDANRPRPLELKDLGEFCGGRYEVREIFDAGGLGVVLLALDKELNRQVAVKTIRPELLLRPIDRKRFEREAAITGNLEHPGVVPLYGYGADPLGQPYYAMKFIHGEKFSDTIARFHADRKPFPAIAETHRQEALRKLLTDLIRVCETIAFAHSRNIIHRDIKPDNIRVGQFGEVLLLDWGLAKRTDDETSEENSEPPSALSSNQDLQTKVGVGIGTLLFMSPEQATGQPDVGIPADIFSLGATLYHILTGQYGVDKDSPNLWAEVTAGNVVAPRDRDTAIPRALEAICLKAMSRAPEDRYATASQMAQDLENWLAQEPISAWRDPWHVKTQRWIRRHKTLATSLAAALLMAVITLSIATILLSHKDAQLETANANLRSSLYQAQVAYAGSLLLEGEQDLSQSILKQCPESERGLEWNYLRRVLGKPRDLLEQRLQLTSVIEVSPDGQRVAVAGEPPLVPGAGGPTCLLVIEVATGNLLQEFRFGQIGLQRVWFSPDSSLVAVEGNFNAQHDFGVRVYEIKTAKLIWSADEDEAGATSVGFVGFGDAADFYTTSGPVSDAGWDLENWSLSRWSAKDGSAIADLPTKDPRLASLEVWTLEKGVVQVRRRWNDEVVRRLPAYLRDGQDLGIVSESDQQGEAVLLATERQHWGSHLVRFWPPKEPANVAADDANLWWSCPHEGPVHAIVLNDDGRLAASATTEFLRVWDVTKRQLLLKVATQAKDITMLRFANADRTLIAAGPNSGVRAWEIADSAFSTITEIALPQASRWCLNSRTGLLFIARDYGNIQVWDVAREETVREIDMKGAEIRKVQGVTCSRDGRLLAIAHEDRWAEGYPRRVTIVELASGKILGVLAMTSPAQFTLGDSQLLAVQSPRNLIDTLTQDIVPADPTRFSKSTLDRFRDQNAWKQRNPEQRHDDENRNVILKDLGAHNQWMVDDLYQRAGGFLQVGTLMEITAKEIDNSMRLPVQLPEPVFDFAPVSQSLSTPLVTNSLGTVMAIPVIEGVRIGPVPGAEIFSNLDPNVAKKRWATQNSDLLNDRERELLTQDSSGAREPGTGTGKLLKHPEGRRLQPLAFSDDTELLATCVVGDRNRSRKCEIRIWDTSRWEHWDLAGHSDLVTDAIFTKDGTRLFTAGLDGTVKMWHVQTGNLLATFRDAKSATPTTIPSPIFSIGLTEDQSWLIAHTVDTVNLSAGGEPGEVLVRWDLRRFQD